MFDFDVVTGPTNPTRPATPGAPPAAKPLTPPPPSNAATAMRNDSRAVDRMAPEPAAARP
jgi:hypothetical protein